MKRALLLFMSTLLMGLGMQVRADESDHKFVTIDGIKYLCEYVNGPFFEYRNAQLSSGKDAEGEVAIPDTIYDNGISYAVIFIWPNAFAENEKITRLTVPRTVTLVGEKAFAYCTNLKTVVFHTERSFNNYPKLFFYDRPFDGCKLDTMIIDWSFNRFDFDGSLIKDLYIQSNDTAAIGGIETCTIDKCHLGDIHHLIIDSNPFGIYWWDTDYSIKAVSVEAVEPPTVEGRRNSELKDIALRWTVLFVPDGSEEKYRQAEFWKDFYCIKPLSEMNRYDEYVAEAHAAFSEWVTEYMAGVDTIAQDINECTIEGNQLQFTSAANAKVCDLAGRIIHSGTYTQGESLTLPEGVSIVTVNGRCFKVAVK